MRKVGIALALLVLCLVITGTATASHVRPEGATPLYVGLVPAYRQCTTATLTHGAPLAFPSCRPPSPASDYLTVGTPDANGARVDFIGHIRFDVKPADVNVEVHLTGVRCLPATSAGVCFSPNVADGPDYSGNVQGNFVTRITDHYNGDSLTDVATMIDIPYPVDTPCTATASTQSGAVCSVLTSLNTIVPGGVKANQRANWQIGQVDVVDGGPDGNTGTADNTRFVIEGVFVP